MNYSDFVREYKSLTQQKSQQETQKEELTAGTEDFAKIDETVTPEMRKSMMSELSRAMQERTTDKNMDNYERE